MYLVKASSTGSESRSESVAEAEEEKMLERKGGRLEMGWWGELVFR